jgi:pyruvate/2-oxoglutarate dehydrogenase complex dihydrolipoamide acyltransferase (E2) component
VVGVRLEDAAWEGVEPDTEALLERWLVEEGASVHEGDPLASVVLVKTNFEISAPATGVVRKILVAKDATFGRSQDLAVID